MIAGSNNCLELHDARLKQLTVLPGGIVEIEFRHICLYERCNENLDDMGDVWSAQAKLVLYEVTHIEVVGTMREDDYITMGNFIDREGNLVGIVDTSNMNIAMGFEFQHAGSGASVKAFFRRACWNDVIRVRRIQ